PIPRCVDQQSIVDTQTEHRRHVLECGRLCPMRVQPTLVVSNGVDRNESILPSNPITNSEGWLDVDPLVVAMSKPEPNSDLVEPVQQNHVFSLGGGIASTQLFDDRLGRALKLGELIVARSARGEYQCVPRKPSLAC